MRPFKDITKFLKQRGWKLKRHGKGGHQLWGLGDAVFLVSVSCAWDIHSVRRQIIKLEQANESHRVQD